MRVPLLSGTYQSQSIIANAQRCVNLYPEVNPPETTPPTQVTHYQRPGLTLLATAPNNSPWRGLYYATNDVLYGVSGNKLYFINAAFGMKELGTLQNVSNPVGMFDNGNYLIVVDGTAYGYTVEFATGTFANITDSSFVGSNTVGYVDTFTVFNQPNTRNFYCTLSNSITFDPTYIAAKTGEPDLLVGLAVVHREIWLIGQRTTEVWYDSGAPDFPFQIIPGVFIQHGCSAVYSIAKHDLNVFWLSQDKTGKAIVMMGVSYQARRISTHAIENEISSYTTISDAIGYCYQQNGHAFYVLTFPTADRTWVYDTATNQWHERTWVDGDGVEHRDRTNCCTFAYGKVIAGDWENGKLYEMSLEEYTDNGDPIVYRRSFPHILNDGNRMIYKQFSADIECGDLDVNGADNQLTLSISDDRGRSFWNPPTQTLGATGQYLAQPQWNRLGLARDRVFELSWSVPAKTALQGAWIEVLPSAS